MSMSKSKQKEIIKDMSCQICFADFSGNQDLQKNQIVPEERPSIAPLVEEENLDKIVMLDCSDNQGNWYHHKCLYKCMLIKISCPYCRQEGSQLLLETHNKKKKN